MTREQWLNDLTACMIPMFYAVDAPIPVNVRVSIGWPATGINSNVIGECWSTTASGDGTFEIFLRPTHTSPMSIAATLAHELVHAAVGIKEGHGKVFGRVARAIGLAGKLTATVAGKEFEAAIQPMLDVIGPYPGAPMKTEGAETSRPKKQGTRMIKCQCEFCGYTARTSQKWLDEAGAPHCPTHGEMTVTQ